MGQVAGLRVQAAGEEAPDARRKAPGSVEDLKVFNLAHDLALDVYRVTKEFPTDELYGLTSQMRRSASSVPMNLAEGRNRAGRDEFKHFVSIARGSAGELKYQMTLARGLGYLNQSVFETLKSRCEEILRMLTGLYNALAKKRQ